MKPPEAIASRPVPGRSGEAAYASDVRAEPRTRVREHRADRMVAGDRFGSAALPRLESRSRLSRRRASSRLSRYFARAPRRLVNARPMVSFTFDDAAASAHTIGAPMVEQAGGRGVYYIATGLVGRRTTHYSIVDRSQVRELHARGHEIGMHGHSHCAVGWLKPQALRDELARNCDELARIDSRIEALNFAYPFGLVAVERKRALAEITTSSRSIAPGMNAGLFDAQYLRSVELANARLTSTK